MGGLICILKKLFIIAITLVILIALLCACNTQQLQSSSISEPADNSIQVTTQATTTPTENAPVLQADSGKIPETGIWDRSTYSNKFMGF
jgi:hypothetical protein